MKTKRMKRFLILILLWFLSSKQCARAPNKVSDKHFVLSSVYDAMKNNVKKRSHEPEVEFQYLHHHHHEPKYEIQEYHHHPDEQEHEYVIHKGHHHHEPKYEIQEYHHPKHYDHDYYCHVPEKEHKIVLYQEKEQKEMAKEDDSSMSNILKIAAILLAILAIPFLLFQGLMLPMKLIMGIKALTLINTALFGTFVYRSVIRRSNRDWWKDLKLSSGETDLGDDSPEKQFRLFIKYLKNKDKKW